LAFTGKNYFRILGLGLGSVALALHVSGLGLGLQSLALTPLPLLTSLPEDGYSSHYQPTDSVEAGIELMTIESQV